MAVAPGAGAGDQLGVSVSWGESGLFAGARRAGGEGKVYPIDDDGKPATPISSPNTNPRARSNAEFGFGLAVAPQEALLVVGAFMEDERSGRGFWRCLCLRATGTGASGCRSSAL